MFQCIKLSRKITFIPLITVYIITLVSVVTTDNGDIVRIVEYYDRAMIYRHAPRRSFDIQTLTLSQVNTRCKVPRKGGELTPNTV